MRDDVDYTNILNKAARELIDLTEEMELLDDRREKVTNRIYALRDLIFATSKVLGEDPYTARPELFPELIEPETGFTDAIRGVMKDANKYLSPVDIRDELGRRRFNLAKYRNPLATIHQIVRRLVESKEIEPHEDENKKLYKWKIPVVTRVLGSTAGGGREGLGSVSRNLSGESRQTLADSAPPTLRRTAPPIKVPEVPGADMLLRRRVPQNALKEMAMKLAEEEEKKKK